MSIPHEILPTSRSDSRLSHSLGVTHLAIRVGHRLDFLEDAPTLNCAALLHDSQQPPFSHCSEPIQQMMLGTNHEERAAAVILNSPRLKRLIRATGANPDTVVKLITGKRHPLTRLIHGAPDLDSCDHVRRFSQSLGLPKPCEMYDPVELAKGFCRDGRAVWFHSKLIDHLRRWQSVRQNMYDWIYSDVHQAPYTMLRRAVYLAARAGKLSPDFFTYTDSRALRHLSESCSGAVNLIERLEHFNPFECTYAWEAPTKQAAHLREVTANELADRICLEVRVAPDSLAVCCEKNDGCKPLTIHARDGESSISQPPTTFVVKVFCNPGIVQQKGEAIKNLVNTICTESLEVAT